MRDFRKLLAGLIVMLIGSFLAVGCNNNSPSSGITVRRNVDVVIVGAGGAGFAAAYEAQSAGASVLIVEKSFFTGGNTGVAGSAVNAANPDLIRDLTNRGLFDPMTHGEVHFVEEMIRLYRTHPNDIVRGWATTLETEFAAHSGAGSYLFDSPELHALQTFHGGDDKARPELLDHFARNALETLEWLDRLDAAHFVGARPVGMPGVWNPNALFSAIGATWRRSHEPSYNWGGSGSNFFMPVEVAFEDMGGQIETGWRANRIEMSGGRAVGVSGTIVGTNDRFHVTARAVMIATGGFAANRPMLNTHNTSVWANTEQWQNVFDPDGLPFAGQRKWIHDFGGVGHTNIDSAVGDGITMGVTAGAGLRDMGEIQLVTRTLSPLAGGAISRLFYVNRSGERVVKEDGRRDEIAAMMLRQAGLGVFSIMDAETVNHPSVIQQFIMGIRATSPQAPGTPMQYISQAHIDAHIAANPTHDRYDYIAFRMGHNVTAANLRTSFEQIHDLYDWSQNPVGPNPDPFGRMIIESRNDTPPFVLMWGLPEIHHTMGGLDTNANLQVLNTFGEVIPGLYAAGEVIGGVHGGNRLGANAITDVLVFGRLAGQNMAAEVFLP